jgi:hypothetical protein
MALCLATAVLALGADAGYLALVSGQDASPVSLDRTSLLAMLVAACALFSAVGWRLPDDRAAVLVLSTAGCGLLGLGVLGIFSVGLAFLAASVPLVIGTLTLFSTSPTLAELYAAALGGVVAAAAIFASIYVTELPTSCAPGTTLAGGGSTYFHGDFNYTCINGHLSLHTR